MAQTNVPVKQYSVWNRAHTCRRVGAFDNAEEKKYQILPDTVFDFGSFTVCLSGHVHCPVRIHISALVLRAAYNASFNFHCSCFARPFQKEDEMGFCHINGMFTHHSFHIC